MSNHGKRNKKTPHPLREKFTDDGARKKKLKPLGKEKYKRVILEEEE